MIAALAIVALLAGGPKHQPPCGDVAWRRGTEQRVELLRCLSRVFPRVEFETALRVARCESGPELDPRDEYHGSMGMFQHQGWLWRARAIKYLADPKWGLDGARVSPFNAYANAVVTYSMVADRDIGWSPWSCHR